MARRLRIQYSDAIYHVMARGNGRQDIVQDDADRGRLVACLERAVRRSGWSLYAFVLLTNHLHLVLKTPRPNLAKGMQLFLSSYANGWARRHRHCGHLFQGRYRTELVEDETYLWVLTRYVHLNPVRRQFGVSSSLLLPLHQVGKLDSWEDFQDRQAMTLFTTRSTAETTEPMSSAPRANGICSLAISPAPRHGILSRSSATA